MIEKKTEETSSADFEKSYHYSDEKEAKQDLNSQGYKFKGYVNAGDGYEHIWIEQWEGPSNNIARLVWLGNITLKSKPMEPLSGAKVTIMEPEHPKYKEAKKLKFT